MYRCESWTIKKAECWRTKVFELWCWRRLLRFPWTARRSNQSILKEINPKCSLECLMLKLQYFTTTWCKELTHWERPDAGKDWAQEEKGLAEDEMVGLHQWLNGHEFEQTLGDCGGREARHAAVHGVTKSRTWLSKLNNKFPLTNEETESKGGEVNCTKPIPSKFESIQSDSLFLTAVSLTQIKQIKHS